MSATLTAPTVSPAIFAQLRQFVAQRPGFEFANYGDVSAYRSDSRTAQQQANDAYRMLAYAEATSSDVLAQLPDAFSRAFSGRLSYDAETGALTYCAGQYFPLEYRAAVCAVIASAIWHAWRMDLPESDTRKADTIRARAMKYFGRGIASRWFR